MTGMPTFGFNLKAKLKQIVGAAKAASTVDNDRRRTECPESKTEHSPKVKRPISVKGKAQAALARRKGGNKIPSAKIQPSSIISELPYQPANVTPSGIAASVNTVKGNGLGNPGVPTVSYTGKSFTEKSGKAGSGTTVINCGTRSVTYKEKATKAKYIPKAEYAREDEYIPAEEPASAITTKQEREAKRATVRNAIVNKQVGKHMQDLKKTAKPITQKKRKLKKKTIAEKAPVVTKKQRKAAASIIAANKRAKAKKAMDVYVKPAPTGKVIPDPFKLQHLRLEREAELKACQEANLARRGAAKVRSDGAASLALVETAHRKEKREWFNKEVRTTVGTLDDSVKNKKGVALAMARKKYRKTFLSEVA